MPMCWARSAGGFAIANDRLSRQRIPYAAACIGVAVKAQELAIDYAKQRETFGAPLATRQAVQWMIVDNEIDIRTSLWLTLAAAHKAERGEPYRMEAGMAKLVASEAGGRVVDRCHADPRRLRHDQGPAVRALVSRDAHPQGRRGPQRGAAACDCARSVGGWVAVEAVRRHLPASRSGA